MGEAVFVRTFPFGSPVLPRPPSASTRRRVFILGAYPSALHIAWHPPVGRPIKAMAVDNEPAPFWNGADESDYIARWRAAVCFRDGEWGKMTCVGNLNGSSGQWVDNNVLAPLRATRDEACITDCIDTYFSSAGGAVRIDDTYRPFAESARLPAVRLEEHPSERAIVEQGLQFHRDRLLRELSDVAPDIVVTLGNAALRVLATILRLNEAPTKLKADSSYGAERTLSVASRKSVWLPLAHPAAPRVYQNAHADWRRRRIRYPHS